MTKSWRHEVTLAAVALAATAGLGSGASAAESGATLQPYKVRYQVSYRGLSGGQIEATLKRGATPGLWIYETRAFPNLLGRLAVSTAARERSTILINATDVRPLTFDFNDGGNDPTKRIKHAFDWGAGQVQGEAKGKPFTLAATPGAQDTASVQAAMIVELLAGHTPTGFRILTGKNMHDYKYWSEGRQQIVTPLGSLDCEVWASQRPGSNRVSRMWHAPSFGYMPVQAIQFRNGNPEVQLKVVTLER
jgi:hypothetical protein